MQLRRMRAFFLAAVVVCLASFAESAAAGPSLVFDVTTGRVLEHEDVFKRWYPASLTKLMTTYVAFRAVKKGELQFNSPVRISQNAAQEPPSKMGYKPGSVLTLDNALKIILVKSANDIATAIAESVGGSEQAFVARMNAEAERLGMAGTRYVNAHGLFSSGQYTTARDLAILVRALRTEFPQNADYFAIEAIGYNGHVKRNYNILIGRFPGADGMKTGFVCESGFNLIASATRDGRTLAAVVLGARSQVERAEKAAGLLARGFNRSGLGAPTLASLRPQAGVSRSATNLRASICNKQARKERWENRDEKGRLVITSRYIRKMPRDPRVVQIRLGGADGPESTAPRYADVPIPTPRPEYPPGAQAATATRGGG